MLNGFVNYALRWVGLSKKDAAKKAEIERQYLLLTNATTYQAWLSAAEKLDELEGVWEWKKEPSSPYYDSRLIQERLIEMKRLQAEGDIASMVFMLRTGLQRNLGGIGDHMLHDHSHVGTKVLIEEHQKELIRMLLRVCNCCDSELTLEKKLAFFTESRHALGKTALLLSGGASLGMYHFGVLKTLFQHDLLPRIISGSSAGAIVAGIVAVRTNQELERLFTGDVQSIRASLRLEFFDPLGSLERKLRRVLKTGHLMDVKKLQSALIQNMGDVTFHEAYERTGRIVNITVSPGNDYEKPRLLNYLTAPNVLIWSAASASCALPGLYEAVELVSKNARGQHVPYHMSKVKWTDGSLQTDLPMVRLQELFNVNYFIVSQTNPHAIPFVQKAQRQAVRRQAGGAGRGLVWRAASTVAYMIGSELYHRCQQAIALGLAPKVLALLLNQKYLGDVTIVPPLSIRGYAGIISNPTPERIAEFILRGERQTWPSVGIIRSQCEAEMVLDQCVRRLAARAQSRAASGRQLGPMPSLSAAATGCITGPEDSRPRRASNGGGRRSSASASDAAAAAAAAASEAGGNSEASGAVQDGGHRLQRSDRLYSGLGERRHTHLDLNQFFMGALADVDDSMSVSSFGSFLSHDDEPEPAAAGAADAELPAAEVSAAGRAEEDELAQEGHEVNPSGSRPGGGEDPPQRPDDALSLCGAAPMLLLGRPRRGPSPGSATEAGPPPEATAPAAPPEAVAAAGQEGGMVGEVVGKTELAQHFSALLASRVWPGSVSHYSC